MLFERFGSEFQNDLAKFELGIAEGLVFSLADQQPSDLDKFLIGQFANARGKSLSLGFLGGGQRR
jgi:hypothetical protein